MHLCDTNKILDKYFRIGPRPSVIPGAAYRVVCIVDMATEYLKEAAT